MVTDNKKEAIHGPVHSSYFSQPHFSNKITTKMSCTTGGDDVGHGGPLEHGGGRLGLTLVSRQQEGGSLSGVSIVSSFHHEKKF